MSMPKCNSDIIIKGHDPESCRSLFDNLSTSTVLFNGTGQQRQYATFHQILPVLLVFQTAVTYCTDCHTSHHCICLVFPKDIQKKLLALCIYQVWLSFHQCSQGGQGSQHMFLLLQTLFAVGEDDGIGPFLGSQIPLRKSK